MEEVSQGAPSAPSHAKPPTSKRKDFKSYLSKLVAPGAHTEEPRPAQGLPSASGIGAYSATASSGPSRQTIKPRFKPMQTHSAEHIRGPPVDIGVNTEPMPSIPLGSLYLMLWQFMQLITGFLCYMLFYRDQESKGALPRAGANAFVTFFVLGSVVYVGVVAPMLFSSLNDRLSVKALRSKRYFTVFVMWVCFDMPCFIIEFHAFIEVGLIDPWQGISFFATVLWAVVPPWLIYLLKFTNYLHRTFTHSEHEHYPAVPFLHNGYRFGGGVEGSHLLHGAVLDQPSPGLSDMRQTEEVRYVVQALYAKVVRQSSPSGSMTRDELADALQRELPYLSPHSHEAAVVRLYLRDAPRGGVGGLAPASVEPLLSLVSEALNPSIKTLGHERPLH